MKFKKVLLVLLVMIFALVLLGCNKGQQGDGSVPALQVNISGSSQVLKGETLQLRYTLTPANSTSKVTWRSENEDIATINQDGVVYGKEYGIAKIVAETDNGKSRTKVVKVVDQLVEEYPDLQGYTIRIAHSDNRLYEYDPFYVSEDGTVTYEGLDIKEAQEAWNFVEEQFNCSMEVVSYPGDAAWGSARVDYILSQARNNTSQYDFLVITDTWIPELVQGGGLLDLTEWYNKYGENFMDPAFVTSGTYKGKLYSISNTQASIYPIFGYNINLVEELQKLDPTIKEPAQMFLDDEWDFTTFYEFCKKCQIAMDSVYGEGTGHYAISGWPIYIWIGMCNTSGECLANVTTMRFEQTSDVATEAANLLRRMYDEGLVDPDFQVDKHVQSWAEGKAIFNTGSEWFVNDSLRWPDDQWGEGDATRYGYVPYPAATGTHKEEYRLAVTGGQCFGMPVAKDYTGYGEDCTAENIYRAYITYQLMANKLYKEREDYDFYTSLVTLASRKYSSEAAIQAQVYMNFHANEISFYDPMIISSNPVASTYDSDWAKAILNYFRGQGDNTWAEVVEPYKETLEQTMSRVFG